MGIFDSIFPAWSREMPLERKINFQVLLIEFSIHILNKFKLSKKKNIYGIQTFSTTYIELSIFYDLGLCFANILDKYKNDI